MKRLHKRALAGMLMILAGILLAAGLSGGGGPALLRGGQSASGQVQFLSEEKFAREKAKRTEAGFSAESFLWQEGIPACNESEAEIFLPCDPDAAEQWEAKWEEKQGADGEEMNEAWRQILSGLTAAQTGSSICLQAEDMLRMPASAMQEGHAFEALLLMDGGRSAMPFHIILTGLPVICLDKTDADPIVRKEIHTGRIRLLPLQRFEEEETSAEESRLLRCSFHVRGNVASTLKKKPFKISLLDASGDKDKISWLGMREDDDWILNPLYTDSTRVREKTAYELWEEVSALSDAPQASSHLQYVELFMDNTYQGIYGLMEPVDGKQLALEKGDLLYKIDRWDREDPYLEQYDPAEEAQETQILNENGYPCVEIRWPKDWDGTATWDPMQAFHTFVFRTEEEQTLSAAGLSADLDSVATLSLYCALTHAMDNNWKNSLLIAKRTGDGRYTLRRTIWDLNYVFGDIFVFRPEDGYTAFSAQAAFAYTPGEDSTYDYEAFLKTDPELAQVLRAKWDQWTREGISAEKICERARQNRDQLVRSGALAREQIRWPGAKEESEALEEMETWIRRRFLFLDGFFAEEESAE